MNLIRFTGKLSKKRKRKVTALKKAILKKRERD
jgi:hypothetical protein